MHFCHRDFYIYLSTSSYLFSTTTFQSRKHLPYVQMILLSNLRIIQVGWDIETENINFGTEWKWLIQPVLLHHHQIVTRLTKNRHFDN